MKLFYRALGLQRATLVHAFTLFGIAASAAQVPLPVSLKDDWKTIYPTPPLPATGHQTIPGNENKTNN